MGKFHCAFLLISILIQEPILERNLILGNELNSESIEASEITTTMNYAANHHPESSSTVLPPGNSHFFMNDEQHHRNNDLGKGTRHKKPKVKSGKRFRNSDKSNRNKPSVKDSAKSDPQQVFQNRMSISAEKLLIAQLLNSYGGVGRLGRPVRNIFQPVNVYFGLGLIQMDLDEKDKILTMSMWTRYQWTDEYLVWEPGEFDNVTSVRLEPESIWKPDVMLYNTASIDRSSRDALAVVTSDGSVSWYPHTIFHSSCSVDVTNFPFDHQQCHMWFGSWTHPSSEIQLEMGFEGGIDLSTFQSDYKESCGWDIFNITATRKVMPSENDTPNFIVLTYDINMRRKMVFSTYILTLPCVFLACLTLVVFWLPPDRPDRTALAMSIFASFMVLLLILVEAAPPTASSVPKLGLYYCFNMVIIMLAVILSSLVVNISRGGSKPVPKCLYIVLHGVIARLLFLRNNAPAFRCYQSQSNQNCMSTSRSRCTDRDNHPVPNYCDHLMSDHECTNTDHTEDGNRNTSNHNHVNLNSLASLGKSLRDISGTLFRLEDQMCQRAHRVSVNQHDYGSELYIKHMSMPEIMQDWLYMALVLDRFFFYLYVILIVASLSIMFPKPIDYVDDYSSY